MITIYIDDIPYQIEDKGKNLLEVCLSLKLNLPYFCWHPALGSAGACRLCAVKKYDGEKDTKGQIVMSCMEPVVDGLRIDGRTLKGVSARPRPRPEKYAPGPVMAV